MSSDSQPGGDDTNTVLTRPSTVTAGAVHPLDVLQILERHDSVCSISTLATQLEPSKTASSVDEHEDDDHIRIELVHSHLPVLASYDLVEWDRERETVSLECSLAEAHLAFEQPLRSALFGILDADMCPCTLETLTREVVDDDRSLTDPDTVATALHHTHLPLLDEYGVLEYDAETLTIRR